MTMPNDEFSMAFVESIDETMRSLLGQEVLDAFMWNLKNKRTIMPDQIVENLPTVSVVLRKYFGVSASTIEGIIARRFYARYGIEFRRNPKYQLKEYVENARDQMKRKPPEAELSNGPLPLKEDFDMLFVESVTEGIEDVLGKDGAKLAIRFIEHDVPFNKLPQHLPVFYNTLNKNFGKDHRKVELAIARKLYHKLSLKFTENPDLGLAGYVEMALGKLTQREQMGFMNVLREA
jgi:hypothetical protein